MVSLTQKRRSPEELSVAFQNQIRALEASCIAYDGGAAWEAMRIATAICVLVHDGGRKNQSLLTRLGLKRTVQFIASGEEISGTNLLQDQPLILIQVGRDGGRYLPKLDNFPEARSLKFGHWWERDLILRSSTMSMTRRKLAFALRNSEGGAHYGQLDDADYIEVQEKPAWFTDKKQPLLGVEAATMRQIGWEILQSIEAAGLRK